MQDRLEKDPLEYLDPESPSFFGKARTLAGAVFLVKADAGLRWSEAAADLGTAVSMWEVVEARREGRVPSLLNVRAMLIEPDRCEVYTDDDGYRRRRLVAGLSVTAIRMIEEGGPIISNLVERFVRQHDWKYRPALQATVDTMTQFLLDPLFAANFARQVETLIAGCTERTGGDGSASDGCDPLAELDAGDRGLFAKAKERAQAIIKVEPGSDEFWARSALDLMAAVIVLDVMQGRDRCGRGGADG
jgi:hypothetical protein